MKLVSLQEFWMYDAVLVNDGVQRYVERAKTSQTQKFNQATFSNGKDTAVLVERREN